MVKKEMKMKMKKKMKTCFFTIDFPPMIGGVTEFVRNITYYMAEFPEVEHIQVVALNDQIPGIEKPNKKLTILRDDKKSFLEIFFAVFKYSWRFRAHDVFHATSVFPLGFLTVLIGKYIFRKPVFVLFYGTDVLSILGSRKTKWAKIWTLKHATKAIAPSYSTRDKTAQYYNISPSQLPVVYYPLPDSPPVISKENTDSLKKKYGIKPDDFVVLFMGHLVKRKGPEDLLKALSLIEDEKVKLIFVNDGPLRKQLEVQATSYKLQARVIFTGKVPDSFPFYSLAHVFSMPVFFDRKEGDIEGLGVVYLEAQQYGIPVLGTLSGGVPETMEENKSGFLVPEHDAKALAEKIILLKNDPDLCKRMGEYGKKFVRDKFDWRKAIDGHLDAYRSVVNF